MTKIEQLIEHSFVGIKRAKCLKRVGALLATIPLPIGLIKLIPESTLKNSLPWFNEPFVVVILIAVFFAGVLMYFSGVAWFVMGKGLLAREIRSGKNFVRIKEAPKSITERVRSLGAQGLTIDTFVSKGTLAILLEMNANYVQAWGVPVDQRGGIPGYTDACFFVVAALNSNGVKAMLPDSNGVRQIRSNKDLKPEHIAKNPQRCQGIYVIELFGQRRRSRAAASSKLLEYLNRTFGNRMTDQHFRIFARPATSDGKRVTSDYSFENLGGSEKDMHMWQPPEQGKDWCSNVLSILSGTAH